MATTQKRMKKPEPGRTTIRVTVLLEPALFSWVADMATRSRRSMANAIGVLVADAQAREAASAKAS